MSFGHAGRGAGLHPLRSFLVIAAAVFCCAALGPGPVLAADAPTLGKPVVRLAVGTQLGTRAVPLVVSWPRATPGSAGLDRYELEANRDAGPWIPVTLARPLVRTATLNHAPWGVVRFRVRAVDEAGLASDWSLSAPTWPSVAQETDSSVTLSKGWSVGSASAAFGGSRAVTTQTGATATFRFSGRAVAWVARRGPSAGVAEVSVDGGAPTAVNLRRSQSQPRRVVFVAAFGRAAEHTITVTRSDSDGFIDLDAFVVLDWPRDSVMVGAGDIARCPTDLNGVVQPELSGAYETAQVVEAVDGTVFTTGDNVYNSGTDAEFADCYDPTWGSFKDRTRPVPGNHEYQTPGASGYFNYFGSIAGAAGKGWYRYEAGTWRVYALNSECAPTLACYQEQLAWLTADLDAEPHRCVMAYWHRPMFSSGRHGGSDRMAPVYQLLYDEGADLVLVGHDHTYERFAKAAPDGTADAARGIRQFVVGTGGASLYPFSEIHPLSEARQNEVDGVLRLDLRPGSYAWDYLPTDAGAYTDTGTTDCH